MPNFNASAKVHRMAMRDRGGYRALLPARPIHTGTVAECVKYVLTEHDGYPATYSMRLPLEAGLQTTLLHYPEIEEVSRHPQFPK